MNFNFAKGNRLLSFLFSHQTRIAMRLLAFFMFVALLQVKADGLAQRVTISVHNRPLKSVFKEIEKQTDYVFLYDKQLLSTSRPVSVSLKNMPVEEALRECLKDQKLYFNIEEKTIVVSPMSPKVQPFKAKADELPFSPIKMRVTDATGKPLAGATVVNKTSGVSGQTDNEGSIMLDVNVNDVLEITFVGFDKVTYTVKDISKPFTVALRPAETALDDVVINAGYYNTSQKLATGNISKVGAKVIEQQPVTNVVGALIGRVPGLEITQGGGVPGAGFKIRVRGQNSIAAGGSPMFIIDGVPFASESLGSNQVGRQMPFIDGNIAVSPFNSLNPADIESIEILKDADATAIYGSRGANGVILITTKKGKAGKTEYNAQVMAGFSKVGKLIEMANTEEYVSLRKELYAKAGVTTYPASAYDINGVWDSTRYTDWGKELIGGTAKNLNAQMSVSGGSDRTQFLVRGSAQRETTVFPGDFHYDRASILVNIGHRSLDNRFKFNLSTNYNLDDNNMAASDLTRTGLFLSPNAPALYNADGTLNWENGTWTNPLAALNATYDGKTRLLNSTISMEYDLGGGFKAKLNSGYSDYRLDEYMANPTTIYNPVHNVSPISAAYAFSNIGSRQNWIVEPQLNWTKRWQKSTLQTLAGTTFQQQQSNRVGYTGNGFSSNSLIYDMTSANTQRAFMSENMLYKYQAFFGRINYNWDEKYLLNLTARRDGSSRFSPEHQFANFGAIGAAWIFTAEPFIQKALPFVNFGKIRTSYGITGNDQIGDYQFLNTYKGTGATNYQGMVGLLPQRLYNPDFGWESNRKLEVSLEAGLFEDRAFMAMSWYRNRSSNQLLGIPISGVTGFNSIQGNLDAEVQNTGWEFELQVTPVKTAKIKWNVTMNLSIPKNKLISFPGLEQSSYAQTYVVGQPLSIVKRYFMTGTDPVTGVYQYLDVNKDGQISSTHDRTSIHNMAAQYFGGINNSLKVGDWQLDVFVQIVQKTGNNFLYYLNSPGSLLSNYPKFAMNDLWEPGRTDARMQVLRINGRNVEADNAWNRLYQSDATITDIFFARLKNVSLSYQLPQSWMKGASGKFFIQGQNLFTLTGYEGLDPETESFAALPTLRTLTMGLNITL